MLRKRSEEKGKAAARGGADDAEFAARYPVLHSHLNDSVFEDGKERIRSTLLVFSEDGMFKACLNDREEGLQLFVSAGSFEELMSALDSVAGDAEAPWRARKVEDKRFVPKKS